MPKDKKLPKDWQDKTLGEVLDIERGGSPRPIQKYLTNDEAGLNWIKISDATKSDKYIYKTQQKIIKEGLHKTKLVKESDFILSNSMSFGRPYIMKTTGCIHDGWLVLRIKKEYDINQDFLYYLLSSPYVFKQFDYLAAGSTVRNLNIALVSAVKIFLPPIEEQNKIVKKLDTLFADIDTQIKNTEANIKHTQDLWQSTLNQAFANNNNWQEKTLEEVCDLITCGVAAKPQYVEENIGIPFLSAQNVKDGKIILDKYKFISKELHKKLTKINKANKGDILYSRVGAKYGDAAVVDVDFEFSVYVSLTLIKPKSELLNSEYLKHYLNSPVIKKMAKLSITSSGVPNLNVKSVRVFKIKIPPLKTQQQIVKKLDTLNNHTQKLLDNYQNQLKSLEELKKSLLEKAFSGEL